MWGEIWGKTTANKKRPLIIKGLFKYLAEAVVVTLKLYPIVLITKLFIINIFYYHFYYYKILQSFL